jgi:hypothetical protein
VNWSNGYNAWKTSRLINCMVDHFSGDGVMVRLQAGASITDFPLAVGQAGVYLNINPPASPVLRRIDVLNATGAAFHVGCHWGNSN